MKGILIGGKLTVDAIASLGASGLIVLNEFSGEITAGNFNTFKMNGTAYQVTAGKTLYIVQAMVWGTAAGSGVGEIGFGDTNVSNAAGAPTNKVALCADFSAAAANTLRADSPFWKIPATKYPYAKGQATGGNVTLIGFEE